MNRNDIFNLIRKRKSFLCVGLDTDPALLPVFLAKTAEGVLEFNKNIIDATRDLCVSYKINTAFYEAMGGAGWEVMKETAEYIGGEHFIIADAKRGDIGNTCRQYAKAFFENMKFDAVTLNPYMGSDSILPFLEYEGKWAILLALTSNPGADDFEMLALQEKKQQYLFEAVLEKSSKWGNTDNMMYVAGATRASQLKDIRKIIPDHFLLVPGVGSQGGSLEEVAQYGKNEMTGLLVNVSRGIIYAGIGEDYAMEAEEAALSYQNKMSVLI